MDGIERIKAMNRLRAVIIAVPLAVAGCALPNGGVIVPPIAVPPQVQQACTLLSLGVPVAEAFRARLTATQQALLTSAETALQDCAAGNATVAILDLASAFETMLAQQGVTKAALMRRAVGQ
jgi:L-asparaginase II